MATRNVSPGGALLRASRLFSIPAPLPRPVGERSSTVVNHSDSATLPYPTHLTITTPPSSLSKGDWGFKRPLPLRSTTKTSTPLLRVEAIDTIEHITEYGSAADHTLTLMKWQELNMPLSTPPASDSTRSFTSSSLKPSQGVFEENLEATSEWVSGSAEEKTRWKFQGPWLAGLADGEFREYVTKTIRPRKSEFLGLLREAKAMEDTETAQRKAAEEGKSPSHAIKASDITPEMLRAYIKELRQDRGALYRLIRQFLDLPPAPSSKGILAQVMDEIPFKDAAGLNPSKISTKGLFSKLKSPYAETGPPKTHPSAGLSYLRTNRYIYNHPVYGPQEHPPPIQGRVVMPKIMSASNFTPKLGIAGVVTEAPFTEVFNTSSTNRAKYGRAKAKTQPGLLNIEPDEIGGSKVYLRPNLASIDTSGRINLRVDSGEGPALAILLGREFEIERQRGQPMRTIKPLPRPPNITQQGYGLEARNLSSDPQPPSNRSILNLPSDGNEAMDAFRELLKKGDDRY